MRDVRQSSRSVVTLDRAQLVGLGFFAILSGGLMFGLGYSAGKVPRGEVTKAEPPVLSQIDAEHALHEKMKNKVDYTFFKALVAKEEQKPSKPVEPPKAEPVKLAEAAKPGADARTELKAEARPEPKLEAKAEAKVEAKTETKPFDGKLPPELTEPKEPTFATALAPTSPPEVPAAKPATIVSPPAAAKTKGEFTIQVSAFKTESEADVLMSKLQAKGFKPILTPLELQGKGTWYRVRVGHFVSQAAAELTKQKLERENFPTWIVKAD